MVNLITKYIDIWTAAQTQKVNGGRGNGNGQTQYGIKKLRELILELAVRGKLVPQDPNDEPASELFKKIAKEKARLIKEGEIKKQKPLPEISEDEKPFKLPKGWEWARLGDIAQHNSGKTLDRGRNKGTLRDYITTSNLYWGYFALGDLRQMPIRDEELSKCTAKQFDLLICEGGEAGRAAVWDYEYDICFQNHIHRVRLYGGISPYYIYRVMLAISYTGEIDKYRKGVGISNMSAKNLASICVPIPPVTEQHHIVAKVDELMALCDRLEQQQIDSDATHQALVETLLAILIGSADSKELADAWQRIADHFDTLFTTEQSIDQLQQTILQLAVMGKLVPQNPNDEPVDQLLHQVIKERQLFKKTTASNIKVSSLEDMKNLSIPKSWRWQILDDLLIFGPTNGFSPKAVEYETDVRSLTLSATTSGQFKSEHFKFIEADIPPDSDLWLQDGDILVQRGNTIEYVGVSAVYRGESNQFIHPDLMMKLRVSNHIDVRFIHLVMLSKSSRDYLRARASGTSGSMPKINQATLKSLPIPLPPLAEQHRIVAKVDELMALCDTLKARLIESQTTQVQLADAIVKQAVA